MSHAEHEWAREQIAAHLAGGLSAEERARMEAHVAACAECVVELNEAGRFERGLDAAFAPIRPAAGLEERVIRSLRRAPEPRGWGLFSKWLAAAAAAGLLGAVGYAILELEDPSPEPLLAGTYFKAPSPRMAPSAPAGPANGWAEKAQVESLYRNRANESDRLESSVEEELADAKIPALKRLDDMSRDGAAPPPPAAEPAAVTAGEELAVLSVQAEQQKKQFYAFKEDSPKPADLNALHFKPGQLAAGREKEVEGLAKANKSLGENRNLQRRQGEGKGDSGGAQGGFGSQAAQDPAAPPQPARKIIRSGDVEFEVESFDSSVAILQKLALEEKGYIGTVNSEKLANGKVRGSVVVRVPPDNLDTLLLKLRGLGELKSQRIGSQDVTKSFYDSESRLRAARAMEERLLKIIKEGKGEIKDLLLAEKELGEWRTRIEQAEGELRYYNNLINLSTLTVTLQEKEIRAASGVLRTERVDMGLEVEDVEKAHRDALQAVADAKGRVTRSELKQHAAGQLSSVIHFEVAPGASGALRDRLRQLGHAARMDVNVFEENEGGPVRAGAEIRVTQKDSQYQLSMYNLANVAPRETSQLQLASLDVEKAYKDILSRVEKAGGRVLSSRLDRQRGDQTSGSIHFEVKTANAEAVLADVRGTGEVMQFSTTENPDVQNVTRSKRGAVVQLFGMGQVAPRETTKISLAAKDVAAAYKALVEAARKAEAWVLASHLAESDPRNVRATLNLDVRREQEAVVAAALGASGTIHARTSSQAAPNSGAVSLKSRYEIQVFDRATIAPRETHQIGIEVGHVETAAGLAEKIAQEGKGELEDASHSRDSRTGRQVSTLTLKVPFASAGATLERLKTLGSVKEMSGSKNPAVPLNEAATAKFVVTLSNDLILAPDAGPWANIKRGLGVSLTALSYALMLIMVGVCFVLPIALLGWGGVKLWRKSKATPAA